MKRAVVVAFGLSLCFVLVSAQPVAGSPDLTVSVDGNEIQDADRVEVNGTVEARIVAESDGELTRIEVERDGSVSITSLGEGRSSYNVTRSVTPSVEGTPFSVTASDDTGSTSLRSTFVIPAQDPSDIQDAIRGLEQETDKLRQEIDSLESEKQELETQNQRLRQPNDAESDGSSDSPGGMPGFGVFAFLAAVASVGAVTAVRRC